MIETTNPEIDVNELMERVRREANNADAPPRSAARPLLHGNERGALPPPPALALSAPLESKKERMGTLFGRAYEKNQVSSWIPSIFRGFFRRQGGFNRAVLEAFTDLAETNEQLNVRLRELNDAAQAQSQWLTTFSRRWHLANQEKNVASERIAKLDQQVQRLEGLEGEGEQVLRKLQSDIDSAGEHLRNLQTEVDSAGEHLRNLQTEVERAGIAGLDFNETITRVEHLVGDASFLKSELAHHRTLLHEALAPRPSVPSTSEDLGAISGDPLDVFYVSFEDRFRGPRAEIKERLRYYLPRLREANAGADTSAILDLGCGRGEWLELLREENLASSGVDLNAAMCRQCRERELEVAQGDALQYLRALPPSSVGVVTGFHIIEHLPFEILMMLLAETYRVLRPGGLAIFESPNCKNLIVGASNFNIDPTHRNPVFPETAKFMLEITGFEPVAIEYLALPDRQPFSETADGALLNELLFGPQDFAVIGRKSESS